MHDGSIDILRNNISSVQHAAGHVFSVTGVTLDHLVAWFKASIGHLSHRQLLMVGLLSGDDRSIGNQREVDSWVRHQVGLELSQIHIESSIKPEGGRDGGDNLTNQSVEIGVSWTFNVQVASADVINSFIVNHECTVRVLQSSMGCQDGVVGFNNSSSNLGGRVDRELKLRLFAIVHRQSLHQEGSESRSSASTKGMEDQKSLKAGAVISQFTNTVQDQINNLLSNGVVSPGIIVSCIFLSSHQLLRVEQSTVGSGTYFINDSGLQVDKDSSWNMLSRSSFRKESVERIISSSNGLIRRHLSIRLDSMFKAIKFPAGIAHLDASLADMNRDTFPL